MIIGVNILAISINLMEYLNLGMGAFNTLVLFLSKYFKINFGNATFLLHLIFAILITIFSQKFKIKYKYILISIGSIFIITRLINLYGLLEINLNKTVPVFLIVFCLMNFGIFLIMKSNMVITPFDKYIVELANYRNKLFGSVRMKTDIIILIIIYCINSIYDYQISISVFTLFVTFCAGLNIYLYEKILIIIKIKLEKN